MGIGKQRAGTGYDRSVTSQEKAKAERPTRHEVLILVAASTMGLTAALISVVSQSTAFFYTAYVIGLTAAAYPLGRKIGRKPEWIAGAIDGPQVLALFVAGFTIWTGEENNMWAVAVVPLAFFALLHYAAAAAGVRRSRRPILQKSGEVAARRDRPHAG